MTTKTEFLQNSRMYITIKDDFGEEKANEWAETWEAIPSQFPFLPVSFQMSEKSIEMEYALYPQNRPAAIDHSKDGSITEGEWY